MPVAKYVEHVSNVLKPGDFEHVENVLHEIR